ncbi:hypothetical protein CEQ90_15820 [Lewinellaceae bacterium SD302]|nr:hypothetical protein CEQ90_15820 [Lewinellaceae bacterium SD302]
MPFTNYEETVAYGAMIAYVTRTRYMPPWRADQDYGHFNTPLSLSEGQIDAIQRWMQAGFPPGAGKADLSEAPPVALEPLEWDLELTMDTAFEQYDIYFDQFQVFRLPTRLKTDRWVETVEFVPGDASIVRYVSVSLSQGKTAARLDKWDPRYGYTSFGGPGFMPETEGWFTWSIGDENRMTDGSRRFLPAGSELIMYIHYGPTGVKKLDRSTIRLKFAESESELPVTFTISLINPTLLPGKTLEIPAGELTTLQAGVKIPRRVKLYSIEPQGLLLTRSWEVFVRLPGGEVKPLLKISDYDMHWRRSYRLPQPLELPAGSEIQARAVYDNRPENPFLPVSPPIKAHWGSRLYEEQFLLRLRLEWPDHSRGRWLSGHPNQVEAYRQVKLARPVYGKFTIRVVSLQAGTSYRDYHFSPARVGANDVEVNLSGLPYGNFMLSLVDRNGRILDSELFVYWPPEMTKSLLDE